MKKHVLFQGLMVAAALAVLNLTSTTLRAEEVPEAAEVSTAADVETSADLEAPAKAPVVKSHDLNVIVELISGTELNGTVIDLKELALKTSFGETNIPLTEVAGVRFAPADSASTTVVMLNGDSITGATAVELMTVKTEWGIAEVKGANIASVMFVTGLKWESEVGLTGTRWNLADEKKAEAPKTDNAKKSSSSSRRRSSSNYRRSNSLFGL